MDLKFFIFSFEDVLNETQQDLEACILVNYLFRLCNSINRALKVLNVKNSNRIVAQHRILLFHRAKNVLKTGMKILGLVPLKYMWIIDFYHIIFNNLVLFNSLYNSYRWSKIVLSNKKLFFKLKENTFITNIYQFLE